MICSQKFQNQQLICVMKLANNKGFGILNTSGGPAWVGCKHIHGTCEIFVFAEIDCILTAFIQKVQQTPKEDLIYRKTGWGGDSHFTHFTHINRPMRESTFQVIISLKGGKKKTRPKHTYLKLCNITNADPSVIENSKLLPLLLLLWASSSRLHPSITNTKTKQSEKTIYIHNPPKSHAKTVQQSERDLHHVMVVLGAWIISVGGKKPKLQIAVPSLHC